MSIGNSREKEWLELMDEYNEFLFGDDGLYMAFLMDNELEKYYWDFDKIKDLIKRLKDFELKYGEHSEIEKNDLIEKKEILMNMKNSSNGIEDYYKKMSNMYEFIDSY